MQTFWMRNLFDPATAEELRQRIGSLGSVSPRLWGKMRMFIGRIIGTIIKPFVLGDDKPMRPNSPTSPTLIVQDERDLAFEQQRLCSLIDRFTAGGPRAFTTRPHSFFGNLTPVEWAILMYKHLDHHLRQFSA